MNINLNLNTQMRKFNRVNTATGEEVLMFGTKGTILTISKDPKKNSNGKEYHIFSAKVEFPREEATVLGVVYKKAFDFLGGKPEPGAEFGFAASVEDLQAKNNKLWSITGTEVDDINEDMLSDIDALVTE